MAVTVRDGEIVTVVVQYSVIQDDGSEFRDSVTMSIADYENIWLKQKKTDGDKKKMDRYNIWLAAKTNASQVVTPEPPPAEPLRSKFLTDEDFEMAWDAWAVDNLETEPGAV